MEFSGIDYELIAELLRLYLWGTLRDNITASDGDRRPACDVLRFKNEFVVSSGGTGSLIDDKMVLTALHVVSDIDEGINKVCIFNYFHESDSFPVFFDSQNEQYYRIVNAVDIYPIVRIFTQAVAIEREWAVIEIERNAAITQKRLCYYNGYDIKSKIGEGSSGKELCAFGHPEGLPLIFADSAYLTNTNMFRTDLDIFPGNSGCPVFVAPTSDPMNEFTHKIIGVCSHSPHSISDHYLLVQGSAEGISCQCWKENYRGNPAENGSATSMIDNLYTISGISTTNCGKPYQQRPGTQPTTTKTTPTEGECPVIKIKAPKPGSYLIRMRYQGKNTVYYSSEKQTTNQSNVILTFNTMFIPSGTKYSYQAYDGTGSEVSGLYGTGQAISSTIGTFSTLAEVSAMATIGRPVDFPYHSIQSAINALPAGTTLHVAPGVYKENLVINKQMIIIGPADGSALVIPVTYQPAVSITASNVIFKKLSFSNESFVGTTCINLNGVLSSTIEANSITGFSVPIALANGSTGNIIKSNRIHGSSPTSGIALDNSSGNTIEGNIIDYGVSAYNVTNCASCSNTFTSNTLLRKALITNDITPLMQFFLR